MNHLTRLLVARMIVDVDENTVLEYQEQRLGEKAVPKTTNEEVGFLLRLLGERGELVRARLRKRNALKWKGPRRVAKASSPEKKQRLIEAARQARSPTIYPALMLGLNAGLRNDEIRALRWNQIDLERQFLTVGDQTMMDVAGHVPRQMLKHYSHIRKQAKREALYAVWKKQQENQTTEKVDGARSGQDCSRNNRDARKVEEESLQKSLQSGVRIASKPPRAAQKLLKRIGSPSTTLQENRDAWRFLLGLSFITEAHGLPYVAILGRSVCGVWSSNCQPSAIGRGRPSASVFSKKAAYLQVPSLAKSCLHLKRSGPRRNS